MEKLYQIFISTTDIKNLQNHLQNMSIYINQLMTVYKYIHFVCTNDTAFYVFICSCVRLTIIKKQFNV